MIVKNIILSATVFLFVLMGCSNSDDNPTAPVVMPSFTFDNQNYSVLPSQGINELKQIDVFTFNGTPYTRSSITIIGMIGFA